MSDSKTTYVYDKRASVGLPANIRHFLEESWRIVIGAHGIEVRRINVDGCMVLVSIYDYFLQLCSSPLTPEQHSLFDLLCECGAVKEDKSVPSYGKDRCEICGWPLRGSKEEGCVDGNCSYRPEEGSLEYVRIAARRSALQEQAAFAAYDANDGQP